MLLDKTLVHVFKAAWTAVVCLVAGIYMLKQLRVDVTPILASAGVAGLAFAFGAQTLVRDFFAGFFMLLENQYRIGDIIKIGDTGGVVMIAFVPAFVVDDRAERLPL